MDNLLNFEELSGLVEKVPPEKWKEDDSTHPIRLMCRIGDLNLLFSYYSLAKEPNVVTLELKYDNERRLAHYKGTSEVWRLFTETDKKVREYRDDVYAAAVREGLTALDVDKGLVDKIMVAKK